MGGCSSGSDSSSAGGTVAPEKGASGRTTQPAPGFAETTEPLDVLPIKEAQANYDKAKKAYVAAPNDEKAKGIYIGDTNTLADSTMKTSLPPRVMYPTALKLYREVLKVDPTNKHALSWLKTITDIYASMHRTPPGGG